MTAPHEAPVRDDRPAPALFHDGIVIPGALCAELAGALDLLAAFLRGTPPPASCRAPRLSRAAQGVLLASQAAAVQYRQRETRKALAAPTAPLLPSPQPPTPSGQMVTTTAAAGIVGVSPEWVRRAAADGRIRAERAPRNTWLVDLDDVRAWRNGRKRNTHADSTDPERQADRGAA